MSEDELPEGWAIGAFGDLTSNHDGQRIPVKSADREKRHGAYPYYGASGVIDTIDQFLFEGDYLLIAEDGANLLSRSTPIAFPAAGRFWVNNHAHVARPVGGIEFRFLEGFLNSRDLQDVVTGTAQPKLTQAALNKLEVPVPPSAEQRRIVGKVEALLAQVNAARARLAKVPTILKRFRQSILSAACSGRLTEDWRQQDADTTDDGLPEGWQRLEVEALVEEGGIFDGPFGSNLKTSDYTQAGVRVIRMENIDQVRFIESKRTFISEEKYRTLVRHTVGEGDIIVASFVDDAVRACSLPRLLTKAIAKADCFCVRVDRSVANPQFVAMQIVSRESYDFFHEDIHGATRPRINTKKLRQLPVPLPPLPEQHEIVRRVDALFKLADAIEARLAAATARADKITQAILAKAFRGELVPTEAELARQEGRDYEPASALLARIRAARAANDEKPTRRTRASTATTAATRAKPWHRKTSV
jgi:type I restriction enzyme S subunit